MLGEEGTEQFTVFTTVDDKPIGHQKIHDPFIRSKAVIGFERWELLKAFFKGKLQIKVQIKVCATPGATRAIMRLDPVALAKETAEIISQRELARETYAAMGLTSEATEQPKL